MLATTYSVSIPSLFFPLEFPLVDKLVDLSARLRRSLESRKITLRGAHARRVD